ncbi:EF hand family protein [Asticcacaulis biprosthecium C19]|uniref:EF hand family protein n=1 Tax=Asticcacaulis biprosthecium C19 TaxID=715226 RepID=F4QGG6_9CAUL|nr:EF-hand domain-containing protein [Asticcacaulis biprosthecium]EGF93647.1 EF hand family protein [Asticcacaulis biprosthecium C19]
MKTTLALISLLALVATPAAAGDLDQLTTRLAKADSNHDGMITRAEFTGFRRTQFDEMDRNHDGYVSDKDVPGFARRGERGDRLRRLITEFDKNQDGRIDRTEFLNGPTVIFDRADADGNDVVDGFELRQIKAGA